MQMRARARNRSARGVRIRNLAWDGLRCRRFAATRSESPIVAARAPIASSAAFNSVIVLTSLASG
jgi:hypothetical protein